MGGENNCKRKRLALLACGEFCYLWYMAKNFSKFLGKVALMTAAVLWAGCNDSEKKADETVSQTSVKAKTQQVQEQPKKDIVDSVKEAESYMKRVTVLYGTRGRSDLNGSDGESIGNALAGRLNGEKSADKVVSAESPASDSIAVIEQPKDSLLKKAARIAKVKSEIGMIRALYGVVEEDMGRAVALYGVRPPREIFMPDGPREIHQPKPVPRCFVKELTETDVVAGKENDIDVQTLLKVFRQRSSGIRHICNKNLYKNVKYRAKRTKEFEGKTVFEMKISPSGNVENVEIKSTNDQFSEEIRKSIARWTFPKTQRGGTFTFPINLYEVIPSAASSASEQPLSPTEN